MGGKRDDLSPRQLELVNEVRRVLAGGVWPTGPNLYLRQPPAEPGASGAAGETEAALSAPDSQKTPSTQGEVKP